MRFALLVLGGAVAFGGARLSAQTPVQPVPQAPTTMQPGIRGRGARHGGKQGAAQRALLQGISLSAAQRDQLTAIDRRYRDERRAQHAQRSRGAMADSASRRAAHGEGKALREREMADLRGVLTPAQQATFDRNRTEWRARARSTRRARTTNTGTP